MTETEFLNFVWAIVIIGAVFFIIYFLYHLLKWEEEQKEGEEEEKRVERIKQDPLYKSTLEECPWLKHYIYKRIYRESTYDSVGYRRYKEEIPTLEEAIKEAKKEFEKDSEFWIKEKLTYIADYIEEYINNHPLSSFLTLQDIHDEVLKCSKLKLPFFWHYHPEDKEIELPDYINEETARRYLAIKQIDIRLKLQKLEKAETLENIEKMKQNEKMDELDKAFEIWEKKWAKRRKRKEEAKKPRMKNEETKKLDIIHHIWENNDKEKND